MSNAVARPVIYQPQSILTLLSRAWNLIRANLKKVFLILLPLTVLNTALHFLLSLLSSQTFLTHTSLPQLGASLVIVLGSLALLIPNALAYIISFCLLSRFFYLALLQKEPPSILECFQHLKKKWLSLTALVILLGLVFFGLIVLNLVIFYGGFIFVGVTIGGLLAPGLTSGSLLTKGMILIAILVIGFLALSLLISLVSLEWFLFNFPVVAIATAPQNETGFWKAISKSLTLILKHFPRIIGFSICGLLLSLTFISVLLSPVLIWMGIEQARIGLGQHHTIPFYLQMVWNLWSSLVNCFMMPFYISALVLMWYDCQVRSEGLDLHLWLQQLQQKPASPEA